MIPCPVAHWKQQRPESLAMPEMTYRELDTLIQRLCTPIASIKEEILAFIPQGAPIDIAFFFAAWRMGKTVYPLSFRLPKEAIEKRLEETKSILISPSMLPLSKQLDQNCIDGNLLATLIETSSSTKIACHLLKSHIASARSCAEALDLNIGDSYCLNLPLCHIAAIALFLRTFLAGATLIFPQEWKEATHISMVPTQLYRLLEKREDLPHLKCLLIGGAPLSKALEQEALNKELPLYSTYGMTEAASMALLRPPGLSTKILPHIELKLSDEKEVLLCGPSLLHSYFGKEPRDPTSWFATNDIGQINNKNELEIVGRKDRQFISGGENIIPEEIERALLQLPDIIEARVDPESDLEFGMRPTAILHCKREIPLSLIEEKLEESLPRFKIPKKIKITTEPLKHSKQSKIGQMNFR